MKRKDCDNLQPSRVYRSFKGHRVMPVLCNRLIVCEAWLAGLCLLMGMLTAPAIAGSATIPLHPTVRVRASATVIADEIRLADVCDFAGFDPVSEADAAAAVLGVSPEVGNSGAINMQTIREVLSGTKVNMAGVTLTGATRCLISRPANGVARGAVRGRQSKHTYADSAERGESSRARQAVSTDGSAPSRTLRDAVYDYFASELSRYRARPDIVFDRSDADVLNLSAQSNTFTVRPARLPGRARNDNLLGLVQLEVDVRQVDRPGREAGSTGVAGAQHERTIPLVVKVAMVRDVLIAHRAINQGATLAAEDIERMSLTFKRVDGRFGVTEPDRIIGKRAKRFISAGSVIHMNQLENVPLVTRGQLVQLRSREGGIQIVTTGKAAQGGLLGETITVRALDRRRLQFEATIVGPGVVEVGYRSPRSQTVARAAGRQSS